MNPHMEMNKDPGDSWVSYDKTFTFCHRYLCLSLLSVQQPHAFLPLWDAKHIACCQQCLAGRVMGQAKAESSCSSLLWSETLAWRDAHPEPSSMTCSSQQKRSCVEVSPNSCWLQWLERVPPSASAFPPKPTYFSAYGLPPPLLQNPAAFRAVLWRGWKS